MSSFLLSRKAGFFGLGSPCCFFRTGTFERRAKSIGCPRFEAQLDLRKVVFSWIYIYIYWTYRGIQNDTPIHQSTEPLNLMFRWRWRVDDFADLNNQKVGKLLFVLNQGHVGLRWCHYTGTEPVGEKICKIHQIVGRVCHADQTAMNIKIAKHVSYVNKAA